MLRPHKLHRVDGVKNKAPAETAGDFDKSKYFDFPY